jgi:SNF2 family DNA or RNA helicase
MNIMRDKPVTAIEKHYKWSGQYKPFDHQKKTAAFLTSYPKAFCFNEQGTGKTASAIWASDFLIEKSLVKRVLIVCPLSIMDSAWRQDLETFAPHLSVDIAHGAKEKREKTLLGSSRFVIINYDGVKIVKDAIVKAGFDLIIVDEATHYKNPQSQRWKVLNKIAEETGCGLWMMTGTPAAQSPVDAYGLAKLINPNGVPRFFSGFRDQVMQQISRFTWVPKPSAVHTVYAALQPAIRFTKEQCLDLPDMLYTKRRVALTRQQKTYYEKLRKEMIVELSDDSVTAVNAAVALNKLLQISSGAAYTDDGGVIAFDIDNRYKVLKEAIDETDHKVLVFVPFKHTIQLLADKLNADGIDTEVIQGSVSASRRAQTFKDFQEKKSPRVLVIQPQSAAHGVTLTAANTVVWWSPTPSLETYAQANARVHRAGQTNKCIVIQLEGSTAERRMYKLLDKKIDIHSQIIGLYKEILD